MITKGGGLLRCKQWMKQRKQWMKQGCLPEGVVLLLASRSGLASCLKEWSCFLPQGVVKAVLASSPSPCVASTSSTRACTGCFKSGWMLAVGCQLWVVGCGLASTRACTGCFKSGVHPCWPPSFSPHSLSSHSLTTIGPARKKVPVPGWVSWRASSLIPNSPLP